MARFRNLTVSLALILSLVILPTTCFAKVNLESVQALQWKGRTFCTAFSINETEGYWGTAAHCAVAAIEGSWEVTIAGQPAWIVAIGYPAADVAVFQSHAKAPAFKLAAKAVEVCTTEPSECEVISIVGYPGGITRTRSYGHVAARSIPITHPSTGYYMASDILDITVMGGNSGSPVLNAKGEVIGVLWGAFNEAPLSLSVPLDATRRVLSGFMQ